MSTLVHRGWTVWTGPGDPKQAGCTYPWRTPWRVTRGDQSHSGVSETLNEAMRTAISKVDSIEVPGFWLRSLEP
jgi:hypothetical protein